MRHSGANLDVKDWEVRLVPHCLVKAIVKAQHYTRSAANTSVYAFGLFRKGSDQLLGGALWMPPLPPVEKWAAKTYGCQKTLNLSWLVVDPEVPRNGATFLMARSIRAIRRDARYDCLVTYADTEQGHTGAIYRAANWVPAGEGGYATTWVDPKTGRQVSRKATKDRTFAQLTAMGYERHPAPPKKRFIMKLR